MRKTILAAALCLLAAPVGAQSLQGQWQVTVPKLPDYLGSVLIDAAGRATVDAPSDAGRPARYRGYVTQRDIAKFQIISTDSSIVIRTHCVIQSSDLIFCYTTFADGTRGHGQILTRVGPGPHNLARSATN